jgi:ATP-dependent helicase/nuclease subunit A
VERYRWRARPERPVKPAAAVNGPPAEASPRLPDFLRRPPPAAGAARPLTPSGAAAALDDTDGAGTARLDARIDALDRARGVEQAAARRGRLVHRLMELLPQVPPPERAGRAAGHLARVAGDLPAMERDGIVASVLAVLDDPRFAPVFGPGSRSEVAIAGTIKGADGRDLPVFGQVDRLVTLPGEILVVDFKTGRTVPDVVPDGYAAQLALYRAVLARLSPGVAIRAGILWTQVPRLDAVEDGRLDALVTRLVTNMGTPAAPDRP